MKGVGGYLLAGMSAMGGVVGIYFFAAVGQDGDLTQLLGSTNQVLVSASSPLSWQVVTLIPLILGLLSFMAAVYRAYDAT